MRTAYTRNYHVVQSYVRNTNSGLAKKYGVRGFPSMIFVNARGEVLCRAYRTFNNVDDGLSLDRFVHNQLKQSTRHYFPASEPAPACGRAN